MTRLDQLIALRDAVRDGSPRKDWMPWIDPMDRTKGSLPYSFAALPAACNKDMNAALALFAALLPGWAWCVESANAAEVWPLGRRSETIRAYSDGGDPARALVLAILEALIAKEEG